MTKPRHKMTRLEEYLWLEQCVQEFEEQEMYDSAHAMLDRMDGIWNDLSQAEKHILNHRSAQRLAEQLGLTTDGFEEVLADIRGDSHLSTLPKAGTSKAVDTPAGPVVYNAGPIPSRYRQ